MPRTPHPFRYAFTKYAYIFPFIQILVFVPVQWTRTDQDRDTTAYYLAAEKVDNGESMYEPYPPPGPHVVDTWYYLYPPFFASAVSLIPHLPYVVFANLWLLVLLVGFWIFAACVGRMVVGKTTLKGTLVVGAALNFVPGVLPALNLGQADVLVWAMVGLALAYPSLLGAGFMAAALTKVLGVWPLAVGVFREGRSVVRSAAGMTLAAVALATLVLGPMGFFQSCVEWFTKVLPTLGQGQFDSGNPLASLYLPFSLGEYTMPSFLPPNYSLPFAPLQIAHSVGWWTPEPGNLPVGLRLYLSISSLAAPLFAGWYFRKQPVDMHCALVLSAALLFSPIFRITNLPILLLPGVIYFAGKARRAKEAAIQA